MRLARIIVALVMALAASALVVLPSLADGGSACVSKNGTTLHSSGGNTCVSTAST